MALSGRTRVDCLNATHAIEFDWGCKWAEAIGQALHYAMMTGKQPGVVLILRRPQDIVYVNRVGGISAHYNLPITVLWVEGD